MFSWVSSRGRDHSVASCVLMGKTGPESGPGSGSSLTGDWRRLPCVDFSGWQVLWTDDGREPIDQDCWNNFRILLLTNPQNNTQNNDSVFSFSKEKHEQIRFFSCYKQGSLIILETQPFIHSSIHRLVDGEKINRR